MNTSGCLLFLALFLGLAACGSDEEAAGAGNGSNGSMMTSGTGTMGSNSTFKPPAPDAGQTTVPFQDMGQTTPPSDMSTRPVDMSGDMPTGRVDMAADMGAMADMKPAVDMNRPLQPCEDPTTWNPAWEKEEQEMLKIINLARTKGGKCGGVTFPPSMPLTLAPKLRGVARCHSEHMIQNMYLKAKRQEVQPDGSTEISLTKLATATGYQWTRMGINVGGLTEALAQFNQWSATVNACNYLLDPEFTEVGIGYKVDGTISRFTEVIAKP